MSSDEWLCDKMYNSGQGMLIPHRWGVGGGPIQTGSVYNKLYAHTLLHLHAPTGAAYCTPSPEGFLSLQGLCLAVWALPPFSQGLPVSTGLWKAEP
jgi:hypothetical protein